MLFTAIEIGLFRSGFADGIAASLLSTGRGWLLVIGGFMLIGWLASRTASSARSLTAQYVALAGYVAAEAIIFVPLLYVAEQYAPSMIRSAAAVTLACISLTIERSSVGALHAKSPRGRNLGLSETVWSV